ncbi:MAG: winged helix-turn-helix domain-containing protein [Candidatus Sulfotelmatobacter sp.]
MSITWSKSSAVIRLAPVRRMLHYLDRFSGEVPPMEIPAESSHRVRFGEFELDPLTRELWTDDRKISLQEQPFQILVALLERPGQLVTRDELTKKLWPNGTFVDFGHSLNTAVNRLRAVFGDSAERPRFIESLPRRGYRFIAPVTSNGSGKTGTAAEPQATSGQVYECSSVSEGTPPSESIAQLQGPNTRKTWYLRAPVIALILIAAAAIGYDSYEWKSRASGPNFDRLRFTKLTNSGKAEDVAISPDGSYVVYSQRDHNGVGLWLHHIATGSEAQILSSEDVDFRGLTFSPDGNSVYFVRTRKEIGSFKDLYAMPVLGGHARLLTRNIDSPVSFSPDGRQFVYTEGFGPPYGNQLRIANSDGSQNRVLATVEGTSPNFHAGPAWSPDGRTIVVSLMLRGDRSGYVLDAVSLSDGSMREVFSHAGVIGRPLWLPDNETVLTELDSSTGMGQLWTIPIRGGKEKRVTNDLANWGLRIDTTRDSHTVSGIQWSVAANLWSAPVTNLSKSRQITDGELPMTAAVARRDGKILAVSGNNDLWVVNSDGTGSAPFSSLREIASPVVCGDFVVAASYTSGVDPDQAGSGSVKATKLASGRMIVQHSYQSGPVNIMRVDGDGLNPSKLAGGFLYSPTCSPDGKSVFYISMGAPQRIMRVPVEGGDSQIVGDVPGQTVRGTMRVSPDGRFLAFPYDQERPTPLSKLAVVSAETGKTVKIYDAPGGIYRESCLRWSPDGTGLQYLLTKGDVTNIWDQPLSGGPPHQVTKFTAGRIFDFNWTADGKQLLVSRGEVSSDVVLLSNLR